MIPLDVLRNLFTIHTPGARTVFDNLQTPATPVAVVADLIWDGTILVLSSDTSALVVGEWIRLTSDGKWFEIISIDPNVSVTISNPTGATIPTGNGGGASEEIPTPDSIPLPGGLYKIAAMGEPLLWIQGDSVTVTQGSFLGTNDQEVLIVPPSGSNLAFIASTQSSANGEINIVPMNVADLPLGDLRALNPAP